MGHLRHSSVKARGTLENTTCLICNDLPLPFATLHCSPPLEKPLQQGVCEQQRRRSTDRTTLSLLHTTIASARDAVTCMLTCTPASCWRSYTVQVAHNLCHTMDLLRLACSRHPNLHQHLLPQILRRCRLPPSLARSSTAVPHRRLGS